MKMLKKHGKKVSVILLAMALAVSPMLPIVKAADDDTCQIRNHYFFIEEETAYIDSVFKLTSEGKELGSNSDLLGDEDTFTDRQYTSQYVSHFGIDSTELEDNKQIQIGESDADLEISGVTVAYDTGETEQNGYGGKIDTKDHFDDWVGSSSITPSKNLTMTSTASFYNNTIPEGYKLKSIDYSNWSKDDWYTFTDMYINALKVKKNGDESITEENAVLSNDEDYYFIHNSWENIETESDNNHYLDGPTDWRDSDTTGNMGMFAEWASNGETIESEGVQKVIDAWMKASIDVNDNSKTAVPDENTAFENIGDETYSNVAISLRRDYGDLSSYKSKLSNMLWQGQPQEIDVANYKDGEYEDYIESITDTYYYYRFPTMVTLTYEGTGDVCTVDTGVEPGSGETNNKYGVASYALIGTLLVGAASAYIYARKSNKFNKI